MWLVLAVLQVVLFSGRISTLPRVGRSEVWRASIAEALAVIELLDQRIAPIEAELAPLAQANERVQLLRTIPGLGSLLGLTIAAEIAEIARFPSPAKLVGYSGLVPRVHQSGESSRTGRLSKAGSPLLRWAAVGPPSRPGVRTTPGTGSTSTSATDRATATPPRPPSRARC
jgi:transposase